LWITIIFSCIINFWENWALYLYICWFCLYFMIRFKRILVSLGSFLSLLVVTCLLRILYISDTNLSISSIILYPIESLSKFLVWFIAYFSWIRYVWYLFQIFIFIANFRSIINRLKDLSRYSVILVFFIESI
jgi:hypothetical protein